MSKGYLNHQEFYRTKFKLEYRKLERKPNRYQISNTFQLTMEEFFETLETADVDMTTVFFKTMIEPIFNINFSNTLRHQNGPNQFQHVHKHTSQKYQYRSFQIQRNFSSTYLK